MDSATFNGTSWVNEFSTDGTLGGNSDRAVPTEKAVKTYVVAQAGGDTTGIGTRINLKVTTADSSSTPKLHSYATGTMLYKKMAIADSGDYTGGYVTPDDLDDAKALKVNISDTGNMLNTYARKLSPTFTGTPAAPTAAAGTNTTQIATTAFVIANHDTAGIGARIAATEDDIAAMKDTVEVQMIVTDSTLSNTELETGNIFVVSERLDGYILTRVKIYSPDINGGTITMDVYRTRTTQVKMTSTAASLTSSTNTAAVVNASYDDVVEGDWIELKYTDNGVVLSIGLNAVLTFKKP
jgi:hypothetical protein